MRYEFRVTGRFSPSLTGEFPELDTVRVPEQTVLFGTVTDEAHLYGLLLRFQDLGLHVEEVRRLPESPASGGAP
ncbi:MULTISPECIES: hypothetical protein [unclassified Streptomyces]|uniref:hypothetical protein n=1 Tax=unclassified Streptomyces TaxID=2593676 RepID=UPI000C279B1A|nr:hypothetical protein [Streptomyces sp. CB02959]PJN39688.1 hypothetical protein CG747_17355 [Streptomyces sp. CB02959]